METEKYLKGRCDAEDGEPSALSVKEEEESNFVEDDSSDEEVGAETQASIKKESCMEQEHDPISRSEIGCAVYIKEEPAKEEDSLTEDENEENEDGTMDTLIEDEGSGPSYIQQDLLTARERPELCDVKAVLESYSQVNRLAKELLSHKIQEFFSQSEMQEFCSFDQEDFLQMPEDKTEASPGDNILLEESKESVGKAAALPQGGGGRRYDKFELYKENDHFSCPCCSYKTPRRKYLTRHLKIHTMEKPFGCSQCPYRASDRSHLMRHMITHSGEKPFECGSCGFRTSRKSVLALHEKTHSEDKPFGCSLCPYETACKRNLTRHLKNHKNEKQFRCTECAYRASDNSHLIRHMRTHTGEKPFACDHCAYRTSHKSALNRHMKIHA